MEVDSHEALLPFKPVGLNMTELHLSFYIAYLVLRPTITTASTILGYVTHVKYYFREHGCKPEEYKTAFMGQIRRGVENTFPQQADKRSALFLPFYVGAKAFTTGSGRDHYLVRLATVLGFIGMLRPHTFNQLQPSSLAFVLCDTTVVRAEGHLVSFCEFARTLPPIKNILGFFIEFQSKTMNKARAHFPCLAASRTFRTMCPVRHLLKIPDKRWVKKGFLKKSGRGSVLSKYLQALASTTEKVAPYALRIGGRTWYLSKGMDRQFVDYLGTWKSPEASARYYRASPATVMRRLTRFYMNIQPDLG